MNDPPAGLSAVGIEAVEWLPNGPDNLTVRVRGRWRRGRPMWSGQSLLVVEALGRRDRFPAMPEPPSVTGAGPGTWQMSFSVPGAIPTQADARVWLQLGGMLVPVPVPVEMGALAQGVRPQSALAPDPVAESSSAPLGGEPSVDELEAQLVQLRLQAERESAARAAAEARAQALEGQLEHHRSRSTRAYEAIEALREELDALREDRGAPAAHSASDAPPEPQAPSSEEHAAAEPSSASLAEPHGPRSQGRWLERALRHLARRSAPLAGRLLVVLVPGAEMDQERLVKLLAAGPLGRGRARALGDGASFDQLKRRLSEPGSVAELRLEPGLSLALTAVMIDPRWTIGERFTIAYQLPSGGTPGPCLEIQDGTPATVNGRVHSGEPTTTIVCPADLLSAVLAGERPAGTRILGEQRPLELTKSWLERAQSD